MMKQRWDRSVSATSVVGASGNAGQANYAAAKAGMQGFTKTLAIELGPFGVTANAIAPGYIATDMTADTARRIGMTVEEHQAKVAEALPVRRVGVPDDIADAVSIFCSPFPGYVTGQVLYVAGTPRT